MSHNRYKISFYQTIIGKITIFLVLLITLQFSLYLFDIFFHNFVGKPSVPEIIKAYSSNVLKLIFIGVPLICIEFFLPGFRDRKKYGKGLLFWSVYEFFALGSPLLSVYLINYLNIQPLLTIEPLLENQNIIQKSLTQTGLIFLSILIFDFFYYWFHRLQHTIPFMWRFHAIHHSIENLNCIEHYHHIFESYWRIPFIVLPLAFFIKITVSPLLFISAFVRSWDMLIHANTSFNFGRLKILLADNQLHRIHHSIYPEHYDCNFAAFFPIWDLIFGTLILPRKQEFPPVGIANSSEPKSVAKYIFSPFKEKLY